MAIENEDQVSVLEGGDGRGAAPKTPEVSALLRAPTTASDIAQRIGAGKTVEERARLGRQEMPGIMAEQSKAELEAARAQEAVSRKGLEQAAKAEKEVLSRAKGAVEAVDKETKAYQEFVQPEYKASDYAANAAARLFTGLMLGGVAKISAIGQLQAIRDMQKAEDQGLREKFTAARIKFEESEKARKDFNTNIKDRFDRLMKLLPYDRNAALAEAKIIEAALKDGAIVAAMKAGDYGKANKFVQKYIDQGNQVDIARIAAQAKTAAKGDKPEKPITLPAPIAKTLENIGSTRVSMARMSQSAKPQYFGVAPSDTIANAVLAGVERGLPVGEVVNSVIKTAPKVNAETVGWWKDYQEYTSKVRNLLFGATLTGREAEDFRKFTISPATDPAIAMDYLNKQMQIVNNAVARERKKATALKVPANAIDAYIGLPEKSEAPKSFASITDLDAAVARGEVKNGDRVTVGGKTGTYQE